MRNHAPSASDSLDWLHYEASEAALKRASDELELTRAIIHTLEETGMTELFAYAELTVQRGALEKIVLQRVSEHGRRIDTLTARNVSAARDAPRATGGFLSPAVIMQINSSRK